MIDPPTSGCFDERKDLKIDHRTWNRKHTPAFVCHTESSYTVGLGHVARTSALCEEILARGWSVVLIIEAGTDHKHARLGIPESSIYQVSDRTEARDLIAVTSEKSASPAILVADLHDPLTTTQHPDRGLFDAVVAMHGAPNLPNGSDLIVNPASPNPIFEKRYELKMIRSEVRQQRPKRPWAAEEIKQILVSFGASDPGRQTELFLANLIHEQLGCQVAVALGPDISEARTSEIAHLARRSGAVTIEPANFTRFLSATDLLVGIGGQTCYESMHLGKPVAVVEWSHLAEGAKSLATDGLAAPLGHLPAAISSLSDLIADTKYLRDLADKGWSTIDGRGAQRTLNYVVEVLIRKGFN